jgi:hypothetical protein
MSEFSDWAALSQDQDSSINSQNKLSKEELRHELEQLRARVTYTDQLLEQGQKFAHDLIQPLTYLISILEIGEMAERLNLEDCQEMLKAAIEIRDLLQNFRNTVRKAQNK